MTSQEIAALLAEIEAVGVYHHPHPESGTLLPMRCLVMPWLDWAPQFVEETLEIVLPTDLRQLWDKTSGLVLFEDVTYSQYGLVLYSPDQAVVRHQRYATTTYGDPGDLRRGDFIVGEFIGDLDLVVIRCDPAVSDFGTVVIAQSIDPRAEWPVAASSLGKFLREFLQSNRRQFGEKYWER